ncbi:MAG: hypothetical protein KME42_05970 [Tildeniella nuda ZEHNDER 1965/U140]|nr:hypothetical protein [Tildeniella nuda ZEHNDER 1965/U140]
MAQLKWMFNGSQTAGLVGLLLLTSGVAVESAVAQSIPTPSAPTEINRTPRLPASVRQAVRRDLSQRPNVPIQSLTIARFTRQTWRDSCFGLGGSAESCLQVVVPGWRVEVTNQQQSWFYRTNVTGTSIRLEPESDETTLPKEVDQRLLNKVSEDVRIPATELKIAAVRPAVWDGCLGIFTPGTACTQIAISGWQTIVTGRNGSWVYHLDRDGNRIVQNPTASRSRGGLIPSFVPEQNKPPIESEIVFRSVVSGDLSGKETQMTLTSDGAITQFIIAPNIRSRPIVVKRLSQAEVKQFQQLLERQRFQNLNGLRYLTSTASADYPTTTLQTTGATVQYIDLEKKNLPRALQQVIRAWEKLKSK